MINDGMGIEPRPEYPTFAKPARASAPKRTQSNDDTTHGFIYIIKHQIQYEQAGVLKIGYTDNLKDRLSAANTWSFSRGFEYVLYLPVSDKKMAEDEIHEVFSDVRQGDTEWFKVDEAQAKIWLELVADSFQLEAHQLVVFTP